MEEPQNAEEDLLAFLQPLTIPDEFTFESRNRHLEDLSDDVDQEPIPGPALPAPMAPMAPTAPVAPMAPMDPIDPIEPAVPLAPEAAMIEPKGVANVPPPETNGHKEEKTVVEQDDDAIEYETPKATRKSPAKRSMRSRAAPKARRDDGDQSPHESAAELLKRFGTSSAKKRVEAKPHSENDIEANGRSPVKSGTRKTREATVESAGFEAESSPDPWKFEVVIKPLPPAATQEYIKVPPGDEVYRVLAVIKTDIPGEAWLSVEFEDGRVDQVSRSYRTRSFRFKHRLARLTTFSSHLCNGLFGNEPSGKLSLVTCCLSPWDFTSFLFFTATISFPSIFPQLSPTGAYQLPSTIPGQPSHNTAAFPQNPNIKQSKSWRFGLAYPSLPSYHLGLCPNHFHCPRACCLRSCAVHQTTRLHLLSSGNRYVNLTKFKSFTNTRLLYISPCETDMLCNLHLNFPISQQRPSLSLPILPGTVNTYTQAFPARHHTSYPLSHSRPFSLLISGNTSFTAPPHSPRPVCDKPIRFLLFPLGPTSSSVSDDQPFHLAATAELTSTRSGGFRPAFELSKRASGSCILQKAKKHGFGSR